jgi:hypothetical protein
MNISTKASPIHIVLRTTLVSLALAAVLIASPALASVDEAQTVVSASGMVATATFTLGTPCSAYTLDWGDGETTEQETNEDVFCMQVTQELTLRHTYEDAGTYNVTLSHSGQTSTQELTVSVEKITFDLKDVQSVTSLWVDPNEMMADEEYTVYTITLTDDSVIKVNAGGFTTQEWRTQQFVEAGYTGDVAALIALAKTQEPASDGAEIAEKIKMQEHIIELLKQIIALLQLR